MEVGARSGIGSRSSRRVGLHVLEAGTEQYQHQRSAAYCMRLRCRCCRPVSFAMSIDTDMALDALSMNIYRSIRNCPLHNCYTTLLHRSIYATLIIQEALSSLLLPLVIIYPPRSYPFVICGSADGECLGYAGYTASLARWVLPVLGVICRYQDTHEMAQVVTNTRHWLVGRMGVGTGACVLYVGH